MEELSKNNKSLQILTDSGWEDFAGVLQKGLRPTVRVITQTKTIECTTDHEFFNYKYQKVAASKLKPGNKLLTSSGVEKVVSVSATKVQRVYDILNSGKNNRFYANDLLVSNCEFIIDSETLIDSITLSNLQSKEPLYKMGQVRWWRRPTRGNIYVVSLDPSLGTGGDPAAIQIFEATTFTQVGEWRHNRTTIPDQIKLLADITRHIYEETAQPDKIYYSIENNNIGEAALISIEEYGEDNITGTFISEPARVGNVRRYRRGFNTTKTTKNAACAKLKSLIESRRLTIHSAPLISELKTYVASGGSYAAVLGQTDDLVSASLIVVRMLSVIQSFESSISETFTDHSEIVVPMPFIASMSFTRAF